MEIGSFLTTTGKQPPVPAVIGAIMHGDYPACSLINTVRQQLAGSPGAT